MPVPLPVRTSSFTAIILKKHLPKMLMNAGGDDDNSEWATHSLAPLLRRFHHGPPKHSRHITWSVQ